MTFHRVFLAAALLLPTAAKAEPLTKTADVIAMGGRLHKVVEFEIGKRRVYSKTREQLAEIALMCRANPNVKLTVEGHAFAVDEEDSIALGESRAAIVRSLLIRYGVAPSNITSLDMSREGEPGRYVDLVIESR